MRVPKATGVRLILSFFVLTYAISWTLWTIATRLAHGQVPLPSVTWLGGGLFLLGVFAPSLVAIALTTYADGRGARQRLLAGVFQWQVPLRYYVFAIAYMPVVKLTVALLHRIVTGAWPRFGAEHWYVMAAAITISMWVQAGEEIGWRGFALPRLTGRFGLAGSSLILGGIWAAWHFPLFFVRGGNTYLQSFPLYVLQVIAISVALAWLYWRTRGSLLLVMLLHAAINNTKEIVPSAVSSGTSPFTLSTSLTAWLTVLLLWIAAAFFLLQMRGVKTIQEPGEQRNE